MTKTVDAANGRWREILPALGVSKDVLDGKHHPCPICGGTDRFRFTDRYGDGDYFCNQCGAGKGLLLLQKLHKWDFKTAANEVDKIIGKLPLDRQQSKPKSEFQDSNEWLNKIWRASKLIVPGCPVDKYLRSRGLIIDGRKMFSVLRYAPKLKHMNGQIYPGMLAKFCDADGKPVQIQRSFLTIDGEKASARPHRMNMKREMPKGGAVRLGDLAVKMGIAEGVETALAAAQITGTTVWATTSAQLLLDWHPPAMADHITIFGDNDENGTGQKAAWALFNRLKRESKTRFVEVKIPVNHKDWNDVIRSQGDGLHALTEANGDIPRTVDAPQGVPANGSGWPNHTE